MKSNHAGFGVTCKSLGSGGRRRLLSPPPLPPPTHIKTSLIPLNLQHAPLNHAHSYAPQHCPHATQKQRRIVVRPPAVNPFLVHIPLRHAEFVGSNRMRKEARDEVTQVMKSHHPH
ncbi:hypothetical protein DMENIID0001_171530 [Sergentomyia squamirostris]